MPTEVGYYEQTHSGYNSELAGLDATDLCAHGRFWFKTMPYWLLMETYYNQPRSLTWKFYSTKDGRSVDWHSTGLQNIVDSPEPLYEENPELAKGEIIQVDWAVEGADVSVTRTVSRNDQVLFQDVSPPTTPCPGVISSNMARVLNLKKRKRTGSILDSFGL